MSINTSKKPMQAVVYAILAAWGLVEAFERLTPDGAGFHLRLTNSPWMPLVIERHGGEISIAHYGEQNGDAMRDPEMTFRHPDWTPLTFQNDYAGMYQQVFTTENGREMYKPRLLRELESFARLWARNLREQSFADCQHVEANSLTHGALVEQARLSHLAQATREVNETIQALVEKKRGEQP